jgi:hypothetical protein
VQAKDQDAALALAWQAYKPDAKWPVKVSNDLPDKDGWSRRRSHDYQTSPNEKRGVAALVYYSGSSWTVVLEDMSDAVGEKRGGQLALIYGRLLPKGYTRETFAGKKANSLDQALSRNSLPSSTGGKSFSECPALRSAWFKAARWSSPTALARKNWA